MRKEKTMWVVKLEKAEPAFPLTVEAKKPFPRMRTVKSKERIKKITSDSRSATDEDGTTCEISEKTMRLCVNLMPVLSSAKEPDEEGEEKEESNTCKSQKRTENSSREPSGSKLVEEKHDPSDSHSGLTAERTTKAKLSLTSQIVLPPVSEGKPPPEWCDQTKGCLTPLPAITVHQQAPTSAAKLGIKGCGGSGGVPAQVSGSRPWIDNPLLSKSISAEVHLPDISLSRLDTLLQTVTQRLRKKSRRAEEGPRRQVQHDQLLVTFREQSSVRQRDGKRDSARAVKETTTCGCRVNKQMSLPPLHPAPKPTLIYLSMMKTNHLTANMLR